ncbi:hypothetical protein D3C76_892180 [compost metagenome]|uniref:Uncharacterized protein n=1 Tax=Pseudomonas fluorescens TaxID=294 RepID=A0A5E6QU60_PSEFL|nr:hypothetical protein [Pseudomonas fluorescens]VVM57970.1 hypothetical protein PS659_01157 [Pseudomonas fluorescens]
MNRLRAYWVGQAKWWCSRSLEWWAAHLTVLYIGGAITIMGAKFDQLISLELNEIGDLAAGAFGPVAFLWLVLGYIQQGRELKLSSEALRMQAEELKRSVAQQCEIAVAQKTSLQNYERTLEPLLNLEVSGADWSEGEFYVSLKISNTGDYCESVIVKLIATDNNEKSADPLMSGASCSVRFDDLHEWEDFEVIVEYKKRSGASNAQSFSVVSYHEDGYGYNYYVRKHPFLS